jgi:hypothetical protein
MKKVRRKRRRNGSNGLRPEYRFDYARARPNRFAERIPPGAVAVVLDPDVASVFASSDTVNTFLRSVISAMPEAKQRRARAG